MRACSHTGTHTHTRARARCMYVCYHPLFLTRPREKCYGWTCRRYMSARTFPRCATSVEFARTLLSLSSSISVYETALSGTPYRPLTISLPRISFSTCSPFPYPGSYIQQWQQPDFCPRYSPANYNLSAKSIRKRTC